MGKSWKTTLLGILTAVGMMVGNAVSTRSINPNAPAVTFGNLAGPIGIAALGIFAKDHNVSGS